MKIAVLGLGFMGSTHLRILKGIPRVQVTAVASADPVERSGDLSGVAGNLGGPGEVVDFAGLGVYADWKDAIAQAGVDAVDICLPTHLHAEAALAALQAGKHVLLEKPMALDSGTAEIVTDAARTSGRVFMVAQVLRFFPAYRALAGAVRSGKMGNVRAASFRRRCAAPRWSPWLLDESRSGGAALDLLVHDIDLCLHLFGAPEAVAATGYQDLAKGIDWYSAHLHYADVAVVVAGGWHPGEAFPFSMEYSVAGDRGVIEYRMADGAPVLYPATGGREEMPLAETDGYQAEIEYFVECCRRKRQPELCPPRESAAAVRVAECMRESRAKGGEKVRCEFRMN